MPKRLPIKLEHKPEPESAATTVSRDNGITVEPKRFVKATIYLPRKVHDQLRALAFHERKKMHDLFMEGLDRVFADRGQPAVRELERGE